jgi:uncharacterized protein YndB with AHSA1/START domain
MMKQLSTVLVLFAALFVAFPVRAETLSTEVVNEVVIHRPIEQVFDFATTAENWAKWHPNTLRTEGADDHSALVGEKITEWTKVGSIPGGELFWVVTEHVEPTRWQLEGQSQDGIMHFVLTYTFRPTRGGGTLFRRDLVYEMEKTDLTVLLNALTEPFMWLTSEVAVQQLKQVIEATVPAN